jgi:hypothetical protein
MAAANARLMQVAQNLRTDAQGRQETRLAADAQVDAKAHELLSGRSVPPAVNTDGDAGRQVVTLNPLP